MSDVSGTDWDARIASFTAALLVLCAGMVGVGFVLPSPAESAPASSGPGFRALGAPAVPTRLVVPALKIRARVTPIEVNDQAVLDPPSDPSKVGWWRRSARPGATRGQTVLTGHTVHTGGGVMDDLGKLHKGQRVKIVTAKGTMVYRTTRVVTWSKARLAKRAENLFSQQRSDVRLVLITCTGWTGKDYTSNVVVFADPLGVRTDS